MSGGGARAATVTRPAGLAKGVTAFIVAWLGAMIIAVLTGATAIVIVLAASLVGLCAAAAAGPIALRRTEVESVATGDLVTVGDDLVWTIDARLNARSYAEVRVADSVVAQGWIVAGRTRLVGTTPARGIHDSASVRWSSAGRLGLVWWRRIVTLPIDPLFVAPVSANTAAPVERRRDDPAGTHTPSVRTGHDDIDGVRPWRDGDAVNAVHWPSTLRGGELVVRHRVRDSDEQWVVLARTATGDADGEAARVRHALERGLAAGGRVAISVDSGEPTDLGTSADVLRWCATFEARTSSTGRLPWWRRPLRASTAEPTTALTTGARWVVAAAAAAPLVMLLGPLGYGPVQMAGVLAAIAGAAAVTAYTGTRMRLVRQLAGLTAGIVVGVLLIDVSAINSVIASLRFLMPQLLVALVVMQGFECVDRRAARVSLACSALITAYAAGIRIDGGLGAWLLAACLVIAMASQAVTRADRRETRAAASPVRGRTRSAAIRFTAIGVCGAAVVAVLAAVPVPRGPAQLTLPSWLQERRPTASTGQLAAANGSPLLTGANTTNGTRSGSGSTSGGGSGGYPGFSPTMDTSLRGALGNEVVLRVRAPYPDFWRGQTFTRFDGQKWYVDDRLGKRTDGPEHTIHGGDGDISPNQPGDFIQSYYAEVDLPNIIFAANEPDRVLLDAALWQRPDGALRADVVLPKGSAYTVVSHRSGATAQLLRQEGNFRTGAPAMYMNVPPSTTERTRQLAQQLTAGSASHYDTILAIQRWLGQHVAYNLDAPVPPAGADAVDDFLFESRQGFCEQIASATAVMLRSLGIPARIATGYVPSERDEVAGVWISRASDAHAWVEVRFPNYGWVAFDPTASVPLSGEAQHTTIGGDLVKAVVGGVTAHLPEIVLVGLGGLAVLTSVRLTRLWWRRRQRGRWGVLQDRFVAAAVKRGGSATASNASLADAFDHPDAAHIAGTFDAAAFASTWTDDDASYVEAVQTLRTLEHSARR